MGGSRRKENGLLVESVPLEHQVAAEEIRAHLVLLRGGAPFLSSADARLLVAWLDEGVPVPDVLVAIERASASLRKIRSRIPLSLVRARAHLGKPGTVPPPRIPSVRHPFEGVVLELRDPGLEGLLDIPVSTPQDMTRAALVLVRAFLEDQWRSMADDEREARLEAARRDVREMDEHATPDEVQEVAECWVREDLRGRFPQLSAASLLARASA